jgi:hypothetical protein
VAARQGADRRLGVCRRTALALDPASLLNLDVAIPAVAAINSLPAASLVPAGTPSVMPHAAAAFELIGRLVEAPPARDALLAKAATLERLEGRLIERFQSLGNRFLTHHDMKAQNTIVAEGGNAAVAIVDWTSARMSVAGTGLRLLAGPATQADAAALYVECMQRFGHRLNLRDVLFALTAHQALRSLHLGLLRQDARRIGKALSGFERIVGFP